MASKSGDTGSSDTSKPIPARPEVQSPPETKKGNKAVRGQGLLDEKETFVGSPPAGTFANISAAQQESMRPLIAALAGQMTNPFAGALAVLSAQTSAPLLAAIAAQTSDWFPSSLVMAAMAAPDISSLVGALSRPALTPQPREHRTPSDFFAKFEVEIRSVPELLKALAVTQEKNNDLKLLWRGQQNADWPVDSSLTRLLRDGGNEVGEEQMMAVELSQVQTATVWGQPIPFGALNFLAELQHQSVPTRLIDVSLDPETAVWFAVQESAKNDNRDARLFSWGRSAAPKRGKLIETPTEIPLARGDAFWHDWTDRDARQRNNWGTGTILQWWNPPARNERMRAQRAAFLFDAEPIIDPRMRSQFTVRFNEDWKDNEIAEATRIVGFPSEHNKRAQHNPDRIVPMFTFRIAAAVKPAIRTYLENKGLSEKSLFPDHAGLISHLRNPALYRPVAVAN
ncbi:FRG domain-containing protein [Subtercola vilae]|nr:FRG domain-containing protein [Subtercola vilae]